MRILVRDSKRQPVAAICVDGVDHSDTVLPSHNHQPPIQLDWDQAHDEQGFLRRCPVCACRQLYVRKDFPHAVGFLTVAGSAIVALGLFATGHVVWGFVVLASVATVDAIVYPWIKRCLVCYRCRSEFRDLPIGPNHQPWDLAIGEKYRPVRTTADQRSEAV